jgi:archaellum component FlaC
MSTVGDALKALKQVILLQDRVERIEERMGRMADDINGLADVSHDIDKRLYALERIIDLGAQHARQNRIEEQ